MKILKDLLSWLQKKYVKDYFKSRYSKRVLLCYVLKPYITKNARVLQMHQNRRSAMIIGKIFHEMGYAVDVVNHDTPQYIQKFKDCKYRYIFGMGSAFKEAVSQLDYEEAIFYATGLPTKMHNTLERKRVAAASERWGHKFNVVRFFEEKNEDYSIIDYIIALGNKNQESNFKNYFKGPFYILNDILIKEKSADLKKDWKEAQKHFLFIGSKGKILSGLDLLLDYFSKNPSLNLHILGGYSGEEDFEEFFKDELYQRENIKTYGWMEIGTPEFCKLVEKCASCIMPVVAAGQNGSILTAMSYGLFPIRSKNCNVDSPEGIIIDSLDFEGVEEAINEFLKLKPSELEDKSRKVRKYTLSTHSAIKHESSMRKILNKIDRQNK